MKKALISIAFILMVLFCFGQNSKGLKTIKKYKGDKLILVENYDKNGNRIFYKTDELYEPGVMVLSIDYDSLNRETREILVHSLKGFIFSTKVYEPHSIKSYIYTIKDRCDWIFDPLIISDTLNVDLKNDSNTISTKTINKITPYEYVKNINTKVDIEIIENMKKLKNARKFLSSIAFLNENKNKIKELIFECIFDTSRIQIYGDTAQVGTYKYDKNNREIFSQRKWEEANGFFTANDYTKYDKKGNKIKHVEECFNTGKRDSKYSNYYKYSKTNKLLKEERYIDNILNYKVTYEYDENDYKIKEIEFDPEINQIKIIHYYKNDIKGNVIEEITFDFTKSKTTPIYIYNLINEYW